MSETAVTVRAPMAFGRTYQPACALCSSAAAAGMAAPASHPKCQLCGILAGPGHALYRVSSAGLCGSCHGRPDSWTYDVNPVGTRRRRVLELHLLELSHYEIAKRLGVATSIVRQDLIALDVWALRDEAAASPQDERRGVA